MNFFVSPVSSCGRLKYFYSTKFYLSTKRLSHLLIENVIKFALFSVRGMIESSDSPQFNHICRSAPSIFFVPICFGFDTCDNLRRLIFVFFSLSLLLINSMKLKCFEQGGEWEKKKRTERRWTSLSAKIFEKDQINLRLNSNSRQSEDDKKLNFTYETNSNFFERILFFLILCFSIVFTISFLQKERKRKRRSDLGAWSYVDSMCIVTVSLAWSSFLTFLHSFSLVEAVEPIKSHKQGSQNMHEKYFNICSNEISNCTF